jgi:hypothetical protein
MKQAVLAIAAAFALVAGAAVAQEGGPPMPPPQPEIQIEQSAPGKPDPKALAKQAEAAKARIPALIAGAKVICTPTDSRYAGTFNTTGAGGKKANFEGIEVACKEGLGYIFAAFEKNGPVNAQDCIAAYTGRRSPNDALVCSLPANQHLEKLLQPNLVKAGSKCQATDIRMIGATPDAKVYEVACADGVGAIINQPNDPAAKPQSASCLAASGNLACKLTTPATIESTIKGLVAKADAKCTMEKQRYVMTVVDGDVIEVSCAGGSGMMVVANGATYVSNIPCARASGYSGGCTLTDVKAAQTEEAALYTSEAKKAGFDCDVSKYGIFPPPGGGKEIVELACKNRPDGAVVIFTGPGQGEILNCTHAQVEGYRCSYSPVEASYKSLSDQLSASGKGACVVNGARPIGVNQKNAFVEVSCSDGNPGWVIAYPRGQSKPNDVMSCAAAKVSGVGSCDLAANKKAAG